MSSTNLAKIGDRVWFERIGGNRKARRYEGIVVGFTTGRIIYAIVQLTDGTTTTGGGTQTRVYPAHLRMMSNPKKVETEKCALTFMPKR